MDGIASPESYLKFRKMFTGHESLMTKETVSEKLPFRAAAMEEMLGSWKLESRDANFGLTLAQIWFIAIQEGASQCLARWLAAWNNLFYTRVPPDQDCLGKENVRAGHLRLILGVI